MLVKSVHTHVCLAVSTALEEAATTRRLETRRPDNGLSSDRLLEAERSAVNDNKIN